MHDKQDRQEAQVQRLNSMTSFASCRRSPLTLSVPDQPYSLLHESANVYMVRKRSVGGDNPTSKTATFQNRFWVLADRMDRLTVPSS